MCLHLRTVSGQPPAQIRDVHGSALWPLTCAQWAFIFDVAFTTGVVTRHPYPSPTPPSPATSSSDDRLYADGLGHRVAHLRWTSWGLCVCLCVSVCLLSLLAVVMCIHFFAHFLVRGRQSFYKTTFLSFEILVHCFFVLNLLFVPVSIQHAVTVSLCTRAERHLKR